MRRGGPGDISIYANLFGKKNERPGGKRGGKGGGGRSVGECKCGEIGGGWKIMKWRGGEGKGGRWVEGAEGRLIFRLFHNFEHTHFLYKENHILDYEFTELSILMHL